MAKLTGPLLSLASSGSVADVITTQVARGTSVAKRFARPVQPNTEPQLDQQGLYAYANAWWHHPSVTDSTRESWDAAARAHHAPNSGWSYFVSVFTRQAAISPFSASVVNADELQIDSVYLICGRLNDPDANPPAGNYSLRVRRPRDGFEHVFTAAMAGNVLEFDPSTQFDLGDRVRLQLFGPTPPTTLPRSGLYVVTLGL